VPYSGASTAHPDELARPTGQYWWYCVLSCLPRLSPDPCVKTGPHLTQRFDDRIVLAPGVLSAELDAEVPVARKEYRHEAIRFRLVIRVAPVLVVAGVPIEGEQFVLRRQPALPQSHQPKLIVHLSVEGAQPLGHLRQISLNTGPKVRPRQAVVKAIGG
jgi:hypothetical protein